MTDVVVTDPTRNFGKSMFAASGACVDAVRDRLMAGESLVSVAADFELTDAEVAYCEERFLGFFRQLADAARRAREAMPFRPDAPSAELVSFLREELKEQQRELARLRKILDLNLPGWWDIGDVLDD